MMTELVEFISGGYLMLMLIFTAVISLILGMGLPTIGVYIMLAILVAPALVKVGVPPLAAHLFILYFGMMSLITPPVAPAAYVAAAIAQAPSMATGWTAMRFGWAGTFSAVPASCSTERVAAAVTG